MNVRLKSVVSGAAVLAIASGGLLAGVGAANASVPSPWEPDPNSLGSIVFYNSSGAVITGGNNLAHLADYYGASNNSGGSGIKATLYMAAPDHTKTTSFWFSQQQSASTTYPNAAAPAPLTGPGFVNPLVTAAAADGNLTSFLASATLDSTANYANIIQIRIKTNASPAGKYWETNILYNASAGTWQVNDPVATATTTTLTSPQSPSVVTGTAVVLNALVAPPENGTVAFFDGATQVGSTQNVTTSSGAATVTDPSPVLGAHSYTAVFTPTGGTQVSGSTSAALPITVTAPAIATTTTLAVNIGTGVAGTPVMFTANVTAADSSTPTGTVTFKDGAVTIGTSPSGPTSSPYTLTTSALAAGSHSVTATFNAPAGYNNSTSAPQVFTLTQPTCPTGTCDQQGITADIPAGTLVINTPYTAANPLDVPLTLDPTASFFTGNAAFNGIKVTDTRAGDLPWTLKGQASSLTFGANSDNGQNVGLTGLVVDTTATNTVSQAAGNLTVTNAPAASPVVTNPADSGSLGLGGSPHTLIAAVAGLGTITYKGILTINAPTNLPAGTYTGTITFTVG